MKKIKSVCACLLLLSVLVLGAAGCGNSKKEEHAAHAAAAAVYTCPMHPEIIRNEPGSCPVCGMDLVKKEEGGKRTENVDLETLLRPANQFVVASVQVITPEQGVEEVEIKALGTVAYDNRNIGTVASKVSGRIERLYVRYRYQHIRKGQRIMDIYSPELMTAQQNYLLVLRHDAENKTLQQAARQRLLLLGMSEGQIRAIARSGKPSLTVAVYSNYAGHLHETGPAGGMAAGAATTPAQMAGAPTLTTQELTLKEGMYVQKGQAVFNVYNPDRAWVLLDIFGESAPLVKRGTPVRIVPETAPAKNFRATIDYIEPYFRPGSKTTTARVYFNNAKMDIPVGSPVTATIFTSGREALWLPRTAVLSLGMDQVVFRKVPGGFRPHRVQTGMATGERIAVAAGLSAADSVALNAQFLMDSESFIEVNE